MLCKNPPQVWYFVYLAGSPAACRRIQTREIFSAIEEQVGEKEKNAVHFVYYVPKSPYNSLRSLQSVLAYLFPNCSRIMT
jgi:hypothetical protein